MARSLFTKSWFSAWRYNSPSCASTLTCTPASTACHGCCKRTFSYSLKRPLGGTDQEMHRGIAAAHLRQQFLRGNAPVYHANPPGLAVKFFDLLQNNAQGGFVRHFPRQDFVGQGKTSRRDQQGVDHLRAVRPFVQT